MREEFAGAGGPNQADNLIVLPGVTVQWPKAPRLDPDVLAPVMYDLARISRDVGLLREAVKAAPDAGFRSDLLPFLDQMVGQFAYKGGQIEADLVEAAGGVDDVA